MIAKDWDIIVKRREYSSYIKDADRIINLAYKCKLFCPDIILSNTVLEMKFINDKKYLIFTFNGNNNDNKINVSVGELGKERVDLQWSVESDMQIFSEFLYE